MANRSPPTTLCTLSAGCRIPLLRRASPTSCTCCKTPRRSTRAKLPVEQLGVRAEGPRTLVLELGQPYPYLLERLLYPTGFPVPRHVIEAVGDDWVKPAHWVSNGAYVLEDWQPQAHVAMRANTELHRASSN